MTRPGRLVVVTGTGTDVGKTWVGAHLLDRLRSTGRRVGARKPAQSCEVGPAPTDAELLATATGETPERVCPRHRWYEVAMAPPMAAATLGRPRFAIADLVAELTWPAPVEVGLVEAVGGPYSPLAFDGDTVDLVRVLAPDVVVLVAEPGLGAINAVRLAAAPFIDVAPLVVALNRFDAGQPLHAANRAWLADRVGLDVTDTVDDLAERVGAPIP